MLFFRIRENQAKVIGYWEEMVPLYSDYVYRRTFRVQRSIFDYLLETIKENIIDEQHGGRMAIMPDKKIAMFLKFLGSKDTTLNIAQQFNVTESTFIKTRKQVCEALLDKLMHTQICWPSEQEAMQIADAFDHNGQHEFPGVIGCLDGCHIPIWKPHVENPEAYFNRKKFNSIVLQGTCREDLRFIDVSVGCPGRMHDAKVLQYSSLWQRGYAITALGQYHVLADAAYPLKKWIMTPYRNTGYLTDRQKHYNVALSSKRQTIERAFGMLKKRFPKLRLGIDMVNMDEINDVILAGCILHNMCIVHNAVLEFQDEDDMDAPDQPICDPVQNDNVSNAQAKLKRTEIINAISMLNE